MKIKIYDRSLTIKQVSHILPQLDNTMILDLAQAMFESKSEEDIIEILRQLYIINPDCSGVAQLYKIFEVTPNKILGNQKSEPMKSKKENKPTQNHEHDFDGGLKHVDNFQPSKSPSVLPGVAYKTSRITRELGEITEVPSVDFEMPTVPDLPILD